MRDGASTPNPASLLGFAPDQVLNLVELQKDYAALFVGPFEVLVPPYGSVYLEEEKLLYGDSTLDAKRRYEEDGLSIVLQEPPDHIAIELEYAYFLLFRENELLEAGNITAATQWQCRLDDFLQTHLAAWIPVFAQRVCAGAETDFYKRLASTTDAFIRQESGQLLAL